MRGFGALALPGFAALLLAACASLPQAPRPADAGAGPRIASGALAQIGRPYRYGGDTPRSGFDCSGLVHYAAVGAGLLGVPRTVAMQYRAARPVPLDDLRPGDVLFFAFGRRQPTHDGVYVGGGWFVHAPSSGGHVARASLDNPYWRRHLIAAGRLR